MHVNIKISYNQCGSRVFSRNVVWGGGGGIAFVGSENVKNMKKQNKICCCLGGNFKT